MNYFNASFIARTDAMDIDASGATATCPAGGGDKLPQPNAVDCQAVPTEQEDLDKIVNLICVGYVVHINLQWS